MRINGNIAKLVEQALADCESMNTDRQWAKLYVLRNNIILDYGPIHSNGFHERAIGTRHYFINSNNEVQYTTNTHA